MLNFWPKSQAEFPIRKGISHHSSQKYEHRNDHRSSGNLHKKDQICDNYLRD